METYYLKYIFNMVRRGFVLLLILSGLCLLYFKLSLNMESPHLRPLHQMFGNTSFSSSSFKTIQRKEDSVHDAPSRTNSSQVNNLSDNLKTVQNSHNSNSDSVSLTNLQETKNTNMIDNTVSDIKDLSKADTEATTVTIQATHITTSADKYELKLNSGDNSNTTIKQSVDRISDSAKENKNSLAERKGSNHQSISELIKQKGELTNENLLDSVNEFKTEQNIYSSVDKPKDNDNPSVDELMLKNPSVNKQINNNPSADEQINNNPSVDNQMGNSPSADKQINNSPSADKQMENSPSVDNLVGINPSANQHLDNSPSADNQIDIIPSAENNENNPPAQSVAAKKLDSLSSKLAQRGLIQSPYKLKVSRNVPTEDLMKAGPFNFMTNYKNPCYWSPDAKRAPGSVPILCLPYFFLVGAPKSGTTDLNRRLVQHPQITGRLPKEPHWFTRKRFVSPLRTLRNYQEQFLSEATKQVFKTMDSKGYHNIVFGDCSASNLWDNYRLGQKQRNVSSDIMITNADVIHHLYPKTKIIIMVRDPVERLYSDYMYFSHGTPQHFHDKVLIGIQTAKNCLKKLTVRQCLYTHVHEAFTGVRIHIGIYYQHIMEYLRVFPRDQVMIIKLEDFSSRSEEYMKNLFNFLELEPLNKETLHRIANPQRKANTRKRTDKIVGDMLPETRKLLRQFYKPFNAKLVELLGEKFNYNV